MDEIQYEVTLADNDTYVELECVGNPTKGEMLKVPWKAVWDRGVDIHLIFSERVFVDRVSISFGGTTKLFSVLLIDKKSGNVHYKYQAETGKYIKSNTLVLEANIFTEGLILRMDVDFTALEVNDITIFGAMEQGPNLFPMPSKIQCAETRYPTDGINGIKMNSSIARNAVRILGEKWEEVTGRILMENEMGNLQFHLNMAIAENGYHLQINENGIDIMASDERGFVMGVETLIKILHSTGLVECKIEDKPRLRFRGMHLLLPSLDNMEFAKRFVKYLVSPMGYNAIILEIAGAMKFESHPEITACYQEAVNKAKEGIWPVMPHSSVANHTVVPKKAVREFVEYVRGFGIDVIPEVQSLGHVPFMTHAHPEIAEVEEGAENIEVDTRLEDARPDKFYPHCYCPSNEKSYEIIFDLLDEIIEVFEPREFVHMGHDEVYDIGVCKLCKEKNPAHLFADDVNRFYKHLKKRGLRMMIWSDMLQPVTKYKTPPAIDLIPKDIVLMDFIWYFHLDKNIEENLLKKGFEVVLGNVYSSHFPRYKERIATKGIMGAQTSAWVATDEKSFALEGKFYDFLYTAQMFWSEHFSPEYRLCYEHIIAKMMPELRMRIQDVCYPSMKEGAQVELLIDGNVSFPPSKNHTSATKFVVQRKGKSIIFYHTMLRRLSRAPWQEAEKVGEYRLMFEDGSEEILELAVGKNIGYWNRRQYEPYRNKLYRHTGYTTVYYCDCEKSKTSDGQDVSVYTVEYILPEDKKLQEVRMLEETGKDARIVFCKAELVV